MPVAGVVVPIELVISSASEKSSYYQWEAYLVMERRYYVYLVTNWNHKVMYVGVTNDLMRRISEHKQKIIKGFTQKYNLSKLVSFEETTDVYAALSREKEIKKWRREKKNNLVISVNPEWGDLSEGWL